MIPISDSPNPRGISWVNLLLIAANVLVFLWLMPTMGTPADPSDPRFKAYIEVLQQEGRFEGVDPKTLEGHLKEYDLIVFEHGSRPAAWTWLTMLTSMFLHAGFMHLIGNMLFLWIYGNNCEHRLGKLGYLVVYLATGFAASFGDIALRSDSNVPGVGASGAISGVLGLYIVWFPRNSVRLLVPIPMAFPRFELQARIVLGFYIIVQNIIPAVLGGEGGIAYGAHIGGFIAGMIVAFLLNRTLASFREDKPADPADRRRGPSMLSFGASHEASREPHAALAGYRRAARLSPPGEDKSEAHLGAARVLLGAFAQAPLAYQHLVAASRADPTSAQREEIDRLLAKVRSQVRTVPRRFG